MPFSRFENVSTSNPLPVQEVAGTYNAKEHISASNPLPVMEVEGAYSDYESVSESNPQPVAIIADSGAYSRYEDYSDTNAFPVKFITGQSYDPRLDVSETNPWPVVVVSGGGGSDYEGPLDLVGSAVVAYGMRAISSAWLGENIFRVRRSSDDAELDFPADASTGEAPVAAITAWLDGANGAVIVLYDQSGNGRDLNVESSVGYALSLSSQGSRPSVVGGSSVGLWSTQTVDFAALAFTEFWLVKGDPSNDFYDGAGGIIGLSAGSAAYTDIEVDGSNYVFNDYSGQIDDAYHLIDAVFDDSDSSLAADGVELAPTPDTSGTIAAPINNCLVRTSLSSSAKEFQEWIVWNSLVSAPDRLAIRQNIAAYYGITLP